MAINSVRTYLSWIRSKNFVIKGGECAGTAAGSVKIHGVIAKILSDFSRLCLAQPAFAKATARQGAIEQRDVITLADQISVPCAMRVHLDAANNRNPLAAESSGRPTPMLGIEQRWHSRFLG